MKTATTNRLRLALFFPAFALSALQSFSLSALSPLSPGAGCYQYTDTETANTLNVWYYKPADFTPQTPVLIVMHGAGRTAKGYRDAWVEHARAGNYMMLAPEFSKKDFPGDKPYNFGNYMTPDKQIVPREKWTFMIVERVFDDFIKTREKTDARQYYLYGLSAGSQFSHRFMFFVPGARVKVAVCANAGSYTVPDTTVNWPWGIKGTHLTEDDVRRYLSTPLVILLGDKDIDPKDPQITRNSAVDKQGITRLARGVHFFNFGQALAEKLGIPFGWKIRTAPGAPHGGPLIHAAGAKVIAEEMAAAKENRLP